MKNITLYPLYSLTSNLSKATAGDYENQYVSDKCALKIRDALIKISDDFITRDHLVHTATMTDDEARFLTEAQYLADYIFEHALDKAHIVINNANKYFGYDKRRMESILDADKLAWDVIMQMGQPVPTNVINKAMSCGKNPCDLNMSGVKYHVEVVYKKDSDIPYKFVVVEE